MDDTPPKLDEGLWLYRAVRTLVRAMLAFFYARTEVVGLENIPANGAVLFCGNHRNSIVDPMVILAHGQRTIRFAAADVIFKNPVLRIFLNAVGAVPIRRKQDHASSPTGQVDNSSAFDALFSVLKAGGCMGIFPEGISHDESQLAPFKTGPARLALGAAAEGHDSVFIVPCGLYYSNPSRFRSSIVIRFGEPLAMTPDRIERWQASERAEVRALTDELDTAIRGLTVNATSWETIRILDAVRRLYQPQGIPLSARVELSRRFNLVYPEIEKSPEVQALLVRVRDYLDWLEAVGIEDRHLSGPSTFWAQFRRGFHHFVQFTLLLPVALAGAPIHAPLFIFLKWGGRRFAPRADVVATTKLIAGLLLTLLMYGLVIGSVAYWWGPFRALWLGLCLPFTGLAFVRVVERIKLMTQISKTFLDLFLHKRVARKLTAERTALCTEVDAIVTQHLPDDMDRLYPALSQRNDGAS